MSTATKRSHADALAAAIAFKELFPSHTYTRWEFAGSLRRGKPDVGDVEHVVIPAYPASVLAGGREMLNSVFSKLDAFVPQPIGEGQLFTAPVGEAQLARHVYPDGRNRWGKRYRGVDFQGMLHEIFIADESNWGCILTIRTGPGDFSQRLVTQIKRHGYAQDQGYLWRITGCETQEKINCPDEETFFKYAGEAWKEPKDRIA